MHLAGFCLESELRLTAKAMDNILWRQQQLPAQMTDCPNTATLVSNLAYVINIYTLQ
jgi:hypothetical protein